MRTVGLVLYPRFELLDVYGPLEMLGVLRQHFRIEIVGEAAGPVESGQGPQGFIDKSFAEAGPYDIVIAPGGRPESESAQLIDWVKRQAESAEIAASVCTGAAILAATGLLDGREATTNKQAFNRIKLQHPQVHWRRHARWVIDGKYFTSAGISAGIDMTLALIAHLHGVELARKTARDTEYRWNEDSNADEFSDILDQTT